MALFCNLSVEIFRKCIKYYFRSVGVCRIDFMSEIFSKLTFEHAYVIFDSKEKKRIEHAFEIRLGDDLKFQCRSMAPELYPAKDIGSPAYLENMIKEYKQENDFEPVISEPLLYELLYK